MLGRPTRIMLAGALAALAVPAAAQLGLPGVSLPPVGGVVDGIAGPVRDLAAPVAATARDLARARLERIDALVRANRDLIELDIAGAPARRGELLLVDPTPGQLATAEAAGFQVLERSPVEGLDFTVATLAIPNGISLASAQKRLERLIPGAAIGADLLHFQAGSGRAWPVAGAAAAGASIATTVGVIDGAPGSSLAPRAVRGFAKGAPLASNHGSAIVSLLAHAGVERVLVADVYGADPAGGNALAIARGLGWLVGQGAKVVTVSLVGPSSPVLAKAVAVAQAKGTLIVAAVGNDGPAAPPSYPASYPGVLAVTAVDGRNRALIEAGRAVHLDYAAPGADMLAADARGRWVRVRGTSYAAPLVAARAAAALAGRDPTRVALDREARDLGARGPDKAYGRGLLCGTCRRTR